ncbi:Putative viral A-like repeat/charged repetitive motif protein [Borrelia crocidurae DOU]|uniref:Viral A-like repeat/charged repetitive motif protein n=1 Tax=Borrelia crocidurae DOU TaxID=1293575 RepID=W5SN99_9SPIR|nr:membrane protein [Borrelia crocidurae]AHH06576.1 Putative viral A-like repeat/charged repetitive motif protein [Borrelia crocidurae DOU]
MIDFVTILVNLLTVFLILFIYRQYDRRSRALDKIKKFVDLAKDNLEDFIDEKTKEINNLAVDMEAYQRSSIEIIKKIDEVQQKIKNKSDDFAEVEKKIAYHDSMLKDLDDMALKVQDNIQRLQVDGKVVDKLAKTLKNFNTQIDSVDSKLNTIFEKFAKTNKENLESIKIESWEKFDNTIRDFSVRMDNLDKNLMSYQESLLMVEEKKRDLLDKGNEKLENEFKDFLLKIESNIDNYNRGMEKSFDIYNSKYKSIENSLDLIVEQAKIKINDKEDFILTKLNEELQRKFNEVFIYVDDRSNRIKDELEGKLVLVDNEVLSLSSVFKDNTYSRLNSLEETIRQEMRQYEEQFADILEQFRVQIESNVGDIYREYDSKINQFDKEIRERIDYSLEDANSKIESVQSGVKSLLDDLEDGSNNIYLEFKKKVKGDIDSFNEDVFSRMNNIGNDLDLKLLNINTNIQDEVSKLDNVLYLKLKELNEKFVNEYSDLHENVNSKYAMLLESLNLKSNELEIQLESKYKGIADKFERSINDFTVECDERFSNIAEKSDYDYQNFETTSKRVNEGINSLNVLLEQNFETLKRNFESKLHGINSDIDNEVLNLKNHYGEEIGNFVRAMEANKLQYENWQKEVELNLKEVKSNLNSANEEFLNLIETQRIKGTELSENIFNELSEHIHKKAMDMHTNWKDELIILNKSLLDIKISSEELLSSTSSKIDSFEKDVNERLEYVVSKTETFEGSVLDRYRELKDMSSKNSEEVLLGIKEFIDNQAEIIHDKVIMMLNGFNDDFSNREEVIKNKIEELNYSLKDFKIECEDVLNNLRSDLDEFIETRVQKIAAIKMDNQKQIDDFLTQISEDILSKKDMLDNEIDGKLNTWQDKLSEISVNIENVLSSGKMDINSIDSEMALKINDLKTTFEGLESYYLEKIDEFRNQGNVYADELLQNIMSHFDTDTKELEESLSKKFAIVLDKSEEFVKEVDSLLKDKRTDIASFQANIDITIDSLNSRFNDLNREINEKYSKVISDSREYSETLANKLENEIGYEIENVNRRLTDKIDVLSKNMDENIEKFKESFDISRYQVENFEIRIKDIIEKEEVRIGEFLREIEYQYKMRREEAIDYRKVMDNDVIQLKERFIGVINELKNNIEDKSEFLNELYKERFKIVENNFDERYSTFFVESEGAISRIRDEIYNILTDNDDRLRAKIAEMDRNFEIVDARSKEILEFEEGLRKKIEENNNSIYEQFDIVKFDIEKEMKIQFDAYMMKVTSAINDEIEKYEYGINKKIDVLKSIENNCEIIEKNLKEKMEKYNNDCDKVFDLKYVELEDKYNEKHSLIERKIDDKTNVVEELISNKYAELEDKYNEKYLLIEKKIDDKTNVVEELISNKYAELEDKYNEKHSLIEKKIDDKTNVVEELISNKYAELEDKYNEKHLLIERKIDDKTNVVEELISNKYAELEDKYNEKHLLIERKIDDKTNVVEELISNKYAELEDKYNEKHSLIERKIDDKTNVVEELISNKYVEIDNKYSSMHFDVENKLNTFISELNLKLANSSEKMDRDIKEQLDNLTKLKLNLSNIEGDVLKLKEDSYHNVSSHLKLLEEDFFRDLKERGDNLRSSLENFVTSSDQRIENLEREIIKNLEDKENLIKDFRREIEQKFILNKENFYLEFSKEFDVKKRDIESKIVLMETNFTNRVDEFIGLIDNRQSNVDSWFVKVKDDMLNWQKNAYKEFEERSGITKESLNQIKNDIDIIENDLAIVKSNVTQQTKETFENLHTDIKDFEDRTYFNLKNISNEVQGKVLNIENTMNVKISSINEKINLSTEELATQIEIKFLSQQKDLEDKIFEINEKLKYEYDLVTSKIEREKQSVVDNFLNGKDSFESQIKLIQNDVSKLSEQVNTYRSDIEGTIKESYDSFSSIMKEEYSAFENEIKDNLNYSEEEIRTLKNNLQIQVSNIETEFKDRYNLITKSVDENISELKLKALNYDNEFNNFVSETKNNLIAYKTNLMKELDGRYNVINTKIENFERLEAELEKNYELIKEVYHFKNKLEDLRKTLIDEIDLVKKYKGDFESVTREIEDVKIRISDIIEVFNDLKTHQMDIKGIKKDFVEFLDFYSSFKERYKKFTESYDEIQIYKTKLKEIKDDQNTILDNYDRIGNKDTILKSTLESVDRNFDLISEIESKMNVLFKESSGLTHNIGELKDIVSELLANKDLSQEALNNVQNLKEMLLEIEDKLGYIQNVREKVAKSETRLENLNVAAEERIKTLGILVKTESKYKDNIGLNNATVRDSVIKLMRQGWSALEISRATKLSVGEVELILELGIVSKSDD